jgi:hypothetical protein
MTRREILAEVVAHLEAERYAPGPREPRYARGCDPPEPVTEEQAVANLAALRDAIGDDKHLWGAA